MRSVFTTAAAFAVLTMTSGCSSPTTLRLEVQAAPGVTVRSLALRVSLPHHSYTEALPPTGLPGRAIITFANVSMSIDLALDGQATDGQLLHAGATVLIVPHTEVSQTLVLGDFVAGDVDMAPEIGTDMAMPDRFDDDMATPGPDLTCTLGARCAYAFHRTLSITNGSASALPAGYTVRVPLDPARLPASNVRADLNDVRLFGEASGTEYDRVVDLMPPGEERALWFALSAPIAAGTTDTSYAIYYDLPNAVTPPADPAKVFSVWDGFDGNQISALWATNGGPTVANGYVRLHQNTQDALLHYDAAKVPANSALEWRSAVSNPASPGQTLPIDTLWYWIGYQHQGDFAPSDPWVLWISRGANQLSTEVKISGGACKGTCTGGTATPDNQYHWYRIERLPTQTRFYRDGLLVPSNISVITNDTPYAIMMRNFAVMSDLDVDWVRARLLATPEPTVTLGAEQPTF
jgi:hypothetical protein